MKKFDLVFEFRIEKFYKNSKSEDFIKIDRTKISDEKSQFEIEVKKTPIKLMIDMNSLMYPTIPAPCSINDTIKFFLHKKTQSEFSNLKCVQKFFQEKKNCPEHMFLKEKASQFKKNALENCIWVIKFSPNGDYLATGGSDALLRIYEINKNEQIC